MDAKDTLQACVCAIHQNVKLMCEVTPGQTDYKDFLGKVVCDVEDPFCMIHRCDKCPGTANLITHLETLFTREGFEMDAKIKYTAWLQTDRAEIVTKEATVEGFCHELGDKVDRLTSHHFIAKHQSLALRTQKTNLTGNEAIVIGDFAENYSFMVQDAIQGWHWVNSQATLHPFCVYVVDPDSKKLTQTSVCIISDHMRHDSTTVYAFIKVLIRDIKQNHPQVAHIKYFSDGSGAQYKNYKNFSNLCHHQDDFGISAEWNFFATSHGKGPCDGVGGVVKRLATRYSKTLIKSGKDRLLTAKQLYEFANENIQGVKVFWVSSGDVEQAANSLTSRFLDAPKVPGCRDQHWFKPLSTSSLQVCKLSEVPGYENVLQGYVVGRSNNPPELEPRNIQVGCYCGSLYDGKWYIGILTDYDEINKDYKVRFMRERGSEMVYAWPRLDDVCWVPAEHVLCIIDAPETVNSGRTYTISDASHQQILAGKSK